MSWLYSRALVEEYSEGICLDGVQCALWNGTHTPRAFWLPARMTEACRLSRSGMTYRLLTEGHGEALLTSYLEASRARILAQPERAQALTESEAECGRTWPASFARWSRDTSLWKTPQCSLDGGSGAFSEIWPRWGTMRDGECWELTKSERHTSGTGFGLWPTPTANDAKNSTLPPAAKQWDSIPGKLLRDGGIEIRQMGHLNPAWVEWLMGWPIGWTDLKPLGMDKFRQWRQLHGRR